MLQLPVIQRLNPYLLSQLQLSSFAFTLCKCFALILTLLATILIIRFRQNAPSVPLLVVDDYCSDTDDDDHRILSSPSTLSSEFEDDEEEEDHQENQGEYFRVRGSSNNHAGFLRRRSIGDFLSLSEIANSKSVVKLWDTIGFVVA